VERGHQFMADDGSQQRKPDFRTVLEDVKALATVLVMKLRSPAVLAAIGVVATLALALVVVMLLLQTGDANAVSDNAAIIGALVALGGVFTAQMVSIALEQQRTWETRQDDIAKETRLAVAEVTRTMAAAIQEMLWITSKGANISWDELTQEDILDYDNEIKELLPNILGSMMVLSAFDAKASNQLSPLMSAIYRVDVRTALASRQFRTAPEQSARQLSHLAHKEVMPLQDELAQRISSIAGLASLGDNLKKGVTADEGGTWRVRSSLRPPQD